MQNVLHRLLRLDDVDRLDAISSLYVCMVNNKLKYNFVETPCKFSIAELSICKLGSSSLL